MPPLPPIPLVLKLNFRASSAPTSGPVNHGFNILHLQYPAGTLFTATNLVGVAAGAVTWWTTHLASLQSNIWGLDQVTVTAVDGSGTQAVSSHARVSGTDAAIPQPPQCAVAISWMGAPSYRGGKPRTYLMGIPQESVNSTSGLVNATYATNVQAAGAAMITDMSPFAIATVAPVLGTVSYISKTLNPTPPHHRTTPLFWPYTGAVCHQRVDSQRRRTGKEATFPRVG